MEKNIKMLKMKKVVFKTSPALAGKAVEIFLKTADIDIVDLVLNMPEVEKSKGVIINNLNSRLPYWAFATIAGIYKQNLFLAIRYCWDEYRIVLSNSDDYFQYVNTPIRLCEACGEEIAAGEGEWTRFGLVHPECHQPELKSLLEKELDEELSISSNEDDDEIEVVEVSV